MLPNNPIEDIIQNIDALPHESVMHQLSYDQMLILAETFMYWVTLPETEPAHATFLLKTAKGLALMADVVGSDWAPPKQERKSLLAAMAELCEASDKF